MVMAIKGGRLIERQPLRPMGNPRRRLLLTPQIADFLDGQVEGSDFPRWPADAVVSRYIGGYIICVSLQGKSASYIDLERLQGVDEVWTLCFRSPKPGWRLLGRFAARDQFIGLRLYNRFEINTRPKYEAAAAQVIADWHGVLGSDEPIRKSTIDDYLSGTIRNANQDQT